MDLWMVLGLYFAGLGLIVAEMFMPGLVMGLLGLGAIGVSVVFGFKHHWAVGSGQVVAALVVVPVAFYMASRRLGLKESLEGSVSFAQDWAAYVGKEGEAWTELRPAGMVMIEGKRIDVVTAGELVEKGKRVRVVKVEGNRVVVKAV
jgi:membrane-bound serine protease (ClpP class)